MVVQRAAMAAFEGKGTFQELLSQDAEVIEALGEEGIARCFAMEHALRHTGEVVDRALEAP